MGFCPSGALDEDVVVIEATPAPPVPASEEINVTSTDSEVEIVGDAYRWVNNFVAYTEMLLLIFFPFFV